jgi:hypothetical protein
MFLLNNTLGTPIRALQRLSLRSIYDAKTHYISAARTLIPLSIQSYVTNPDKSLHLAFQYLNDHPLSDNAGYSIATIWNVLPTLYQRQAHSHLDLAIQRQQIMLANHAAWKWLENICHASCWQFLVDHGSAEETWITRLTAVVANLLDSNTKSALIEPQHVIPHFVAKPYEWTRANRARILHGKLRNEFILRTVTSIIQQWLGYPSKGCSQAQAWFVDKVVNVTGPEILLLDEFWKSHQKLKSSVFGNSQLGRVIPAHFDSFMQQLHQHPLSDPFSSERHALQDIGLLFEAYRSSNLAEFFTSASSSAVGAPSLPQPLDSPLTEITPSPPPSPSIPPPPSTTGNPDIFLQYLRRLLPYLDHSLPSNSLVDKIGRDVDRYLPFREKAPQRLQSLGPNGPFRDEILCTRLGYFDALFWRGIGYRTQSVSDGRMVFDYPTFQQHFTSLDTAGERYYCNKAAFGPSNAGRTTDSAAIYWESSGLAECTNWLFNNERPLFRDQWRFFIRKRIGDEKAFPQYGNVVSLALTGDYVYAGKVLMPTVDEMGTVVWEINKGGVAGLRGAGYFDADRPSSDATVEAFRDVYDYLNAHLTQQEKELMGFDVIMVEHMLCKFSRARVNGWI